MQAKMQLPSIRHPKNENLKGHRGKTQSGAGPKAAGSGSSE